MNPFRSQGRLLSVALLACVATGCLSSVEGLAAEYGRVSGSVKDHQGNPLVGATILLIGPTIPGAAGVVERLTTDEHGKFSAGHLAPGWYSIKATALTHLPAQHSSLRVGPGQTAKQDFVLSDLLAPVHFRMPPSVFSTWGDDWKWVLRTSASTRPVLRYHRPSASGSKNGSISDSKSAKKPVPPSQRLLGMTPGSAHRDPVAGDPGTGSLMAYVRPLSENADLLVSGSTAASGFPGSSAAAAYRRNILKDDPEEVDLSVHELNFSGALLPGMGSVAAAQRAKGVVLSYVSARRLSDDVTLTMGFEIDYLSSVEDAAETRPRMELDYQVSPSTLVAVRYGTAHRDQDECLLDRVGELNAFPQVTLKGGRPELENLKHGEVSVEHRLGKASQVQVAIFQDGFENTAVWGNGGPAAMSLLAGNALPSSVSSGVTLDAGGYESSGFRTTYSRRLDDHLDAAVTYSVGDALEVNPGVGPRSDLSNLRSVLHPGRTQAVAAKVRARVPVSKTRVIASYEWMPSGRVTTVDPYGEASLGVHPYLDIQFRQPLPYLAFLPAHIEALAEFSNLLAQGYVPVPRNGEEPFFLAPAYRCFRGGFSVEF